MGFGLYEATALLALQATPQVAPMPTYDTWCPGLVSCIAHLRAAGQVRVEGELGERTGRYALLRSGGAVNTEARVGLGQLRRYVKSRGIAAATAVACILLPLGVLAVRWWVLHTQKKTVEVDKAKVAEVWLRLTSDAQTRTALHQAEALTDTPPGAPLETIQRVSSASSSSNSTFRVRASGVILRHMYPAGCPSPDEQGAVNCLDQLYFQAAVVAPMFIAKVQQWASVSAGSIPANPRAALSLGEGVDARALVRWGEAADQACLHWASLLDREQATHDAIQKFDGDVSRMVYLVRQIIVFDHASDQLRCLHELCNDGDVNVVEVINRQAVASETDEYIKPCIKVYMAINTPCAQDLAVSGHICQLELTLKEIWDIFDPPTKGRYRTYRGCVYLHRPVSPVLSSCGAWLRRAGRRLGLHANQGSRAARLNSGNQVHPQGPSDRDREQGPARGEAEMVSMMEEGYSSSVDVGWSGSRVQEAGGSMMAWSTTRTSAEHQEAGRDMHLEEDGSISRRGPSMRSAGDDGGQPPGAGQGGEVAPELACVSVARNDVMEYFGCRLQETAVG